MRTQHSEETKQAMTIVNEAILMNLLSMCNVRCAYTNVYIALLYHWCGIWLVYCARNGRQQPLQCHRHVIFAIGACFVYIFIYNLYWSFLRFCCYIILWCDVWPLCRIGMSTYGYIFRIRPWTSMSIKTMYYYVLDIT